MVFAGDNSTDFNFYSKRAILASIYSITLIYILLIMMTLMKQ